MAGENIILLGVLFLLYSNGSISLTQLLLLLALETTTWCACNCNCQTDSTIN